MDAKRRNALTVLALLWSGMTFAAAVVHDPAQVKMSPWLWQKLHNKSSKSESRTDALVYMREEANLNPARDLSTKLAKGRFVHAALVQTAETAQKPLREWLTSHRVAFDPHWVVNMIVVHDATAEQLKEIAVRDDVMRVVGDPAVRQMIPQTTAFSSEKQFAMAANLTRIGADKVWSDLGVNGAGIVIAGQDTGVQWDHPALKPHYRGWSDGKASHDYNWHDSIKRTQGGTSSCGYNNAVPCDDHDHGTHTVGTVVGDDGVGNQIGVAPGAKWMACRNMDAGIGRPSSYIECFEYFVAPWKFSGDNFKDGDPAMAPHVMNNSWGCDGSEGCEGNEFTAVLKAVEAAGIFVVASAGNDGPGCSTIKTGPAFNTENVLSVGAMDHSTNKIASFSSRGPSTFDNKIGPNVAAPGVNIRSSVRGSKYSGFQWSGTSMAGPHVVGVVALMWAANPKLIGRIEETREILKQTAQPTKEPAQTCGGVSGNAIPNNTWGFGIVDALAAVKAGQSISL